MVNTNGKYVPRIRCRQIDKNDIPAVADLLTRGFPNRSQKFWLHALNELARREPPSGLPQYGYCLESAGTVVGALLAISATVRDGERTVTRCNLSSWYVEPAFRLYAPMLTTQATGRKDVTYLNVSPAPHTRPIIEAQGFSRYCDGVFLAVPFLQGWRHQPGLKVRDVNQTPRATFESFEREILQAHADHGCISVWCETAERAYPFVFRPRLAKGLVPCAQLIYCSDVADFVRFAGPLGRYLAWRGRPFVIIDSNAPIPGLIGTFFPDSMPKYFKGPLRPRLGDLAYTEYAVLGV